MAVGDRFKAAAARGRAVAAALGQRPTTVAVVVETYSAAVGTDGAALLATTTTTLAPAPKVAFQGDAPSAFGGGLYSGPDVALDAAEALVGPITPSYPGGGYDAATLAPTPANATQRVYLLLTGRGVAAGGERFMVTKVIDQRPNSVWLVARRTEQT